MAYLGDIRLGDTFDTKFCTVSTTGAPTTLAGSPVVSAYVGNSTTQLTAGITLSVDFDSVTGMHNIRVVATSGNGYATASNYQLVVTTGTVGGTSIAGYVVAEFSIEARSALMPTTATRTLVVDAAGLADANTVKVGPTGAGTAQTAGDIMADTNDIQTRLPAALVSGRMDSSVGAMAANVLTATAINADAITAAKIATNAIDADALAADAVTEIQAGLATPTNITAGTLTTVTNLTTNNDKTGYAIGVGGIGATAFAAGAIDAAAIAANAIGSSELAQSAAQEVADEFLDRDLAGGASGNTRGVRNALRALRNKVGIVAGTATIYAENDTDAAWTAAITTAAGDPITTVDPA